MKVKIKSLAMLLRSGVVYKLDKEVLESSGFNENDEVYITDAIKFPSNSIADKTVDIVELIDESEGIYRTSKGIYVHVSWFDGKIKDSILQIKEKHYNSSTLEELAAHLCKSCNSQKILHLDTGYCKECFTEKFIKCNNYSYKPIPVFKGKQQSSDKDNPVWYGIELEYSINNADNLGLFNYNHNKIDTKFYLKSDSSIAKPSGCVTTAEIVTHPHSFTELMGCKWLNDLESIPSIDNEDTRSSNGCHVHISRTAFINHKHYAKWYFFLYSLTDNVLNKIGRRECNEYCKNLMSGSILTKENKYNAERREVVINERNTDTVEVRVFSSTNKPKELKQYIQLLESTIKYAKYAQKILTYDGWFAYISKYSSKYAELLEELQQIPSEMKAKVKKTFIPTKEVIVNSIEEVPYKYIPYITKVFVNNEMVEISYLEFNFSSNFVRVNRRDPISMSKIEKVYYAK